MSNDNLKQTISNLNEKIDTLNYLTTKFESKIKILKNKSLQNLCEEFRYHYYKFNGIKRFSIPVFGKISSGKSTLLNYILHLHGVFETDYKISTKFVCIVRHNPNLDKKLKIYNALVNKRGEYKKGDKIFTLWNFEKGEEIKEDAKEIIEKRNHELEKLGYRDSHWEKYFLILEANIPLFRGKNEIYSDFFEFMDIPGLNEFSETKSETEHFYYKELLPFFIYNIGFSLYIFDAEKHQSIDSISIINNIMEQYYNNDEKKQKNSIFILNKIDKVKDEETEINNFKKILENNLKCHIEKEGFFIGLSALLLYLKSFKYNSFFDYLFCIIEDKKESDEMIEDFVIEKMSKDFNTEIEENFDIESEIELPEEDEKKLKIFNSKIVKKGFKGEFSDINYIYYKKYFDSFKVDGKTEDLGLQHKKFEEIINKCFMNIINDYINNYKYDKLYKELLKALGLTEDDIKTIKIKDKNKEIKSSKIDNPILFVKSFKNIIDTLNKLEPNNEFINQITEEYNTTLVYMDKEKKIRIPLLGEYSSGKSSLINTLIGNNYNIIPVDTKVCTNIALVIRYTKNISDIALYHTLLEPTTEDYYCFKNNDKPIGRGNKIIQEILKLLNVIFSSFGVPSNYQMKIINYIENISDSQEEQKINSISYLTKILNREIPIDDVQDKEIQLLLKDMAKYLDKPEINNDPDFYQRAFFLLTVPIEAYDILKLPIEIKEKIELIDFPGLDSTNNIFNSNVLGPLLKFSDGFIFVNKGNSIKEKEKVKILFDIIEKIQNRKFEFSFKSCLFLLNRCDETEVNIEDCKKEYESLFEINKREQIWNDIISKSEILKNADNINVTKFSNKLYSEFIIYKNRINNFNDFIGYYEKKIDKNTFQGRKYLLYLKKRIYSEVCSISLEKYKNYNQSLENTDNLKKYFNNYLSVNENINVIEDIIKMYLFIKDSIEDSKFYIESNAKDFFEKFKNQLILSKFFYEESLKTLAIKYLLNLYSCFEFIKIKIFQDKIDLKFTKEEFINTKKNLKNEYDNESKKVKEFIDSTIKSMKSVYNNLLDEIDKGNIKDYEKSLQEAGEKIFEYKFDLEIKINYEIPIFRKNLLSKLDFITDRLKQININQGNLDSYDLFKSIYDTEKKTFDIIGKGSLGFVIYDLSAACLSTITAVAAEGVTTVAGEAIGGMFSMSSLLSVGFGLGVGLGLAIATHMSIHGLFKLYKKSVEKKRYIELIVNAKKDLEKSLLSYEENVNMILKKITEEIELAVKKFFTVQNVKLDGIKKHMEDWLALREQIINYLKN